MATHQSGQKLHLLDLPLEIRLNIYSLIFQTNPICCVKREPRFYMPVYHVFWNKDRFRRYLFTLDRTLLKICKQIQIEAMSVFMSESPLDLYSWPIDPHHLTGLISKTKHIICRRDKVEEYFGVRTKDVKFDSLKRVTVIDGSHFFHDLTDGRYWHVHKSTGKKRYTYRLNAAVVALLKRGIKIIAFRNASYKFRNREIVIKFRDMGAEITVSGIPSHWEDRIQAQVLSELALDPTLTSFEFRDNVWSRWQHPKEEPHEFRVDYFTNLFEREARPLNQGLESFQLPVRVSLKNGKYSLLNNRFDGRILQDLCLKVRRKEEMYNGFTRDQAWLAEIWEEASSAQDLIALLSRKGRVVAAHWMPELVRILQETSGFPSLNSISKERFFSLRDLKGALHELTGERKALDEAVEICEFLAIAQSDCDQVSTPQCTVSEAAEEVSV